MLKQYSIQSSGNGMHVIFLDEKIVSKFLKNRNKRIICKLNNAVELHCAILFSKESGYYIYIGSAILKKLSLKLGSTVSVELLEDTSTYQFEIPEEFKEVLNTDDAANAIFHSLTQGNQRSLIYLVQQPTSSDKKIERALKIAARLKAGITSPKEILKKS